MQPLASLDHIRAIIENSPLVGREIVEIPILDTGESAFAIQIAKGEVEPMWRAARAMIESTGRWPVASCAWSRGATWRDSLLSEDFFSRFYYHEAPGAKDVSPRALLRLADEVDVDAFVEALADEREGYFGIDEAIAFEIETTQHACGIAPSPEEIADARTGDAAIDTHRTLDHWLMHWEAARRVPADPSLGRQDWFEQDPAALLLLPVANPWDTLAYLHWFGSSQPGAQYYIALGRRWHQRHGAELVAHYGTMLQCLVSQPPTTLDEAWRLAREHDLAAPCTLALPGIALRHHAIGLIGHDRWFLHERP
jgi:hypothetical protein